MGSSKENVRVVIFGNEYSLKSDVDTKTTNEIAQYVNSKMTDIYQQSVNRNHMKIAVLSALNITGELFESREKCHHQKQKIDELHQRINALSQQINDALTR